MRSYLVQKVLAVLVVSFRPVIAQSMDEVPFVVALSLSLELAVVREHPLVSMAQVCFLYGRCNQIGYDPLY